MTTAFRRPATGGSARSSSGSSPSWRSRAGRCGPASPSSTGFAVFLFVTAAWIVSLCLHEYAHARTALHSGDISIGAKGYLTLNPLKYTHALLSIVLPVLFVIMGGIGLPGGAVFIERGRIRGRWKHSLISAAGPLTNVLFAVVCTAPFWLGALDGVPLTFRLRAGVPGAAPGDGGDPELPAGPGPRRLRRDRALALARDPPPGGAVRAVRAARRLRAACGSRRSTASSSTRSTRCCAAWASATSRRTAGSTLYRFWQEWFGDQDQGCALIR